MRFISSPAHIAHGGGFKLHRGVNPIDKMGSIRNLWKWGGIFCASVAWLCQARASSDLYENYLPNTTRVGVKGVNRGKTNTERCIHSLTKMLDPTFEKVLGR